MINEKFAGFAYLQSLFFSSSIFFFLKLLSVLALILLFIVPHHLVYWDRYQLSIGQAS